MLFLAAVLLRIALANAAVAAFLYVGQDYNIYSGSRQGIGGFSSYFTWARFGTIDLAMSATIALVYGAIGFVGKPYDMPIAVLSSLTLGLSIDFAIHFLQRARELYEETGDVGRTLDLVFEAPARAIARNIVVIAIGFVPMFFAGLMPYVTVGAFFCAIMLVSGLTTLVAFPAVLSLDKSGYLAGRGGSKGGKDTPAVA